MNAEHVAAAAGRTLVVFSAVAAAANLLVSAGAVATLTVLEASPTVAYLSGVLVGGVALAVGYNIRRVVE